MILCLFLLVACHKNENLKIKSVKTDTGWGYAISNDDKTIINQTVIPVINDIKSFETEAEALKVGNLVLERMKDNKSPTVTKEDLEKLAIKT